jgi:outer membrane protein assembly factor BamB
MTALNAKTGEVIWRKQMEGIRVRESMGLSADGSLVYVKTMDGELLGISTTAADMEIAWRSKLQLPYELTPSAIVANGESVLVPNHNGLVSSVNAKSGEVEWQHKISNAMVNPILPIGKNKVLVSSMDGKIVYLNVQD